MDDPAAVPEDLPGRIVLNLATTPGSASNVAEQVREGGPLAVLESRPGGMAPVIANAPYTAAFTGALAHSTMCGPCYAVAEDRESRRAVAIFLARSGIWTAVQYSCQTGSAHVRTPGRHIYELDDLLSLLTDILAEDRIPHLVCSLWTRGGHDYFPMEAGDKAVPPPSSPKKPKRKKTTLKRPNPEPAEADESACSVQDDSKPRPSGRRKKSIRPDPE